MSAPVCSPGFQGFPVQITGWSSFEEKSRLVVYNDIELQFAPSQVPMRFDKTTGVLNLNGNSTFIMGGTQYAVSVVRLAQAKQEGLASFSGTPLGELSIWGKPVVSTTATTDAAVFVIPIVLKNDASPAGRALIDALRGSPTKLITLLPQGRGTDVIRYKTCIENDQNGLSTIDVAYWTQGATLNTELVNKLPEALVGPPGLRGARGITLPSWGIPNILGKKLLSTFEQHLNSRERRTYIVDQTTNMLRPYQITTPVGVSTNEFQTTVRLIQNFTSIVTAPKSTQDYKCVAINRSRDIKNGKLVIDPKTGKRFDEEIETAEEGTKVDTVEASVGSQDILIRVATVIGIVLGVTILFGLVYVLGLWFYRRVDAAPPTPTLLHPAQMTAANAANAAQA